MKLNKNDSVEEKELDIDDTSEDIETDDSVKEEDDLFKDDLDMDFGLDEQTTPMEKHSDLLKKLTNFDQFIKEKVNGWLGIRWEQEEEKWIKDISINPIMNEQCAAWCIDYLKTYTRDNNIITNIEKEEYSNMVVDIIDVVWIDIGTRTEEFAIKDNADLHRVCVELQHAAELILMGAGGGKYNELLSTATSRHENVSYTNSPMGGSVPNQKKGGLVGKFKRFLTGG